MAIENLEIQKTEFEHTLGILSQGDRWYVYIDDPKRWWRAYPSIEFALTGAASTLDRLLVHEQGQKIKYARHPLSNPGHWGAFPAQDPRWRVRVTADCGEEQAEWQIEMLDDSAWLTSGYDLKECLQKLGRRLQSPPAAQFEAAILPQQATPTGTGILPALGANVPQKVMSLPPPNGNTVTSSKAMPVPPPLTRTVTAPVSIEDMLTARLDAIGPEIAEQEKRLREVTAEVEKRLRELRRERRALSAARAAYRSKAYSHSKLAE